MRKKDPAFLFYPNDYLGGTMYLTRHQKGCYVDLLVAQFNSGPLSLEMIKNILASDFGSWPAIQDKFKSQDGKFFNERLEAERIKRKEFAETQKKRAEERWEKYRRYQFGTDSVDNSVMPFINRNENSSIGVSVTTTAREVFFNDLPNSSALETIAMDLRIGKDQVLARLPEFKMAAEVDYPDFKSFCRHLKNWIKKNPAAARPVYLKPGPQENSGW